MHTNDLINKQIDRASMVMTASAVLPGYLFMHILNAPLRLAMWLHKDGKFRGGVFPATSRETQGS